MNWGHGITIGLVLFMGFILYMVFRAFGSPIELVAEDYYEQELNYQDRIEAISNAEAINIQIIHTGEQVKVGVPSSIAGQIQKGTITFFKPDNSSFDKEFDMNKSDTMYFFNKKEFQKGLYDLKVDFSTGNKTYFLEKTITL